MNRRWQKDGKGRYETLQSIGFLSAQIPKLDNDKSLHLCDNADIYATYSVLHSKGRRVSVATNHQVGFHYFMAEPAVSTVPSKDSRKGRAKTVSSTQSEVSQFHTKRQALIDS